MEWNYCYEILLLILDFVKGFVSVLISGGTLMASVLLCLITLLTLISQRKHNVKSIIPSCDIRCIERKKSMEITINNYGHGLMTVQDVIIKNKDSGYVCSSIHEIINKKIFYRSKSIIGFDIRPDGHVTLIKTKKLNKKDYKKLKKKLSRYTITVVYCDVYKKRYKKFLDFGENLT